MAKTKIARVDASLVDVFGRVAKSFADKMKKEYGLKELFVSDILASQLLAGKYNGKKAFDFKIEKTSLNKGKLVLIN